VERVTGIEPALSAGETEMVIDIQGKPGRGGLRPGDPRPGQRPGTGA
jgi:hypothetical protein